MKVNGEVFKFKEGMTVSDLLSKMGFAEDLVAVELNLHIISGDRFSDTKLHENDAIEVLRFVGGG